MLLQSFQHLYLRAAQRYDNRLMNIELIPKLIAPSQLADKHVEIVGDFSLASFSRLSELIGEQSDMVAIKVNFGYDEHGRCRVSGKLNTQVQLTCQRCMELFFYKVSCQFEVIPIVCEAEARQLEGEKEYVLMNDGQIKLADLLEEEIILNLPMIAKHGDKHGECVPTLWRYSPPGVQEDVETAHPFKVLEALKNK